MVTPGEQRVTVIRRLEDTQCVQVIGVKSPENIIIRYQYLTEHDTFYLEFEFRNSVFLSIYSAFRHRARGMFPEAPELEIDMQLPVWTKPALWGAAIGGGALAIVAFSAGWIVTTSSAEKMARQQAASAVIMSLTPICVAKYEMEPEKTGLLAALEGKSSWTRGDWIEERGWATMPGSDSPNSQVADACANALLKLAAS